MKNILACFLESNVVLEQLLLFTECCTCYGRRELLVCQTIVKPMGSRPKRQIYPGLFPPAASRALWLQLRGSTCAHRQVARDLLWKQRGLEAARLKAEHRVMGSPDFAVRCRKVWHGAAAGRSANLQDTSVWTCKWSTRWNMPRSCTKVLRLDQRDHPTERHKHRRGCLCHIWVCICLTKDTRKNPAAEPLTVQVPNIFGTSTGCLAWNDINWYDVTWEQYVNGWHEMLIQPDQGCLQWDREVVPLLTAKHI